MPQSRSAGLLAFLLALPSLALVVPPGVDAASSGAPAAEAPDPAPVPGEALEARLRRLSEAIHGRAGQLDGAERAALAGEPWVAAGAWGNGNNRGWVNRGGGGGAWGNRVYGNTYYTRPPAWGNYRPAWVNFRNAPGAFINW